MTLIASAELQRYSPKYVRHRRGLTLLGAAIGALCIIAGYSDERMRLLAKSGRKSQFYYSPLFRERPLRFHAARFPKVAARWKPKKKGRRARRGEDVVNPTVKSSFCRVSASWKRGDKRESPEQKYATSCPSPTCRSFFSSRIALWFSFFGRSMTSRLNCKCKQEGIDKKGIRFPRETFKS